MMNHIQCRGYGWTRKACLAIFVFVAFSSLEVQPQQGIMTLTGVPAWADAEGDINKDEEQDIADEAEKVILDLAAKNDWFKDHLSAAKGIFIAPNMYRGRMLTGGSGLLILPRTDGWSQKAFYTLEAKNPAFKLGTDVLEIILIIKTQRGLDPFYSDRFTLGSHMGVVPGSMEEYTSQGDIVAFTKLRSEENFTTVPLTGILVSASDDFNQSYYGIKVPAREILSTRSVATPGLSGLVSALTAEPLCPKKNKNACQPED